VYCPTSGTFHYEVRTYTVLYMLYFYSRIQEIMKIDAEEAYSLYISGETELFGKKLSEISQRINGGRITKKQTSKTNSIIKSIDMLTMLDEDYCKYVVNKFLCKDEFTDLYDCPLSKAHTI
jgi:hypothetical protein